MSAVRPVSFSHLWPSDGPERRCPVPLDKTFYRVEVELMEDMLGTVPKNREVYAAHIATKSREFLEKQAREGIPLASGKPATIENIEEAIAEEVESVADMEEKGWTTFHCDEHGKPFVFDYLIKGFLQESGRTIGKWGTITYLANAIKRTVFVQPRRIFCGEMEEKPLERPLRGQTAQGQRVALVRSDRIIKGTKLSFQLTVLKVEKMNITKNCLVDVFSYGEYQGLGQWRTGGNGRFKVLSLEEVDENGKPVKRKAKKEGEGDEEEAA